MRALVVERYEGLSGLAINSVEAPDELLDMKDHEVIVKVKAASLNPLDVQMAEGYAKNLFETQRDLPFTLGRDFSGTIESVGSGVWDFKPGDHVCGASYPWLSSGSFADYVVISQNHIARIPRNLSHEEAASIPFAGLTALSAVSNFSNAAAGMNVLVHGAAGGVGSMAVQILKDMGCVVTATCGARSLDQVKSYGATQVIDYSNKDIFASLTPSSFQLVVDASGAKGIEDLSIPLLAPGGTFTTVRGHLLTVGQKFKSPVVGLGAGLGEYAATKLHWRRHFGLDYNWAYFVPNGEGLNRLCAMAEEGTLRPNVAKVFPFEEWKQAFEYGTEQNPDKKSGKVVIHFVV